jgi:hypothetical protein
MASSTRKQMTVAELMEHLRYVKGDTKVTISCPCMDVTTGKFSHNEEVPLTDILDFKDDNELWLFGEEL